MVVHCHPQCIVKFTSFQRLRVGRRCYEYLFACVKRNKMDSEVLTCLLQFIEYFQEPMSWAPGISRSMGSWYFPDYLSALSRTLLRFFGVSLGVKTCEVFLCFVTIMFVLSFVLTSLFSLFYVTRVGDWFLHRG